MKKGDKYAIGGSKLFILSGKRKGRKRDIESYDPSNGLLTFKRVWYERALEWFKKPAIFTSLPWNHRAKSTTNVPTESSAHSGGIDMAKDSQKGTVDEPEVKFIAACVECLATDNLVLMPMRSQGRLIGWMFVCPPHMESLKGKFWVMSKNLEKMAREKLCPKHPRYRAVRRPRADCSVCRMIWQQKNAGGNK